jgi:hypothetical protein
VPVAPVPVAAASPLADLLGGPPRAARVVLSGPVAAYVLVDGGRMVAVTSPGAVVPPCALVLPAGQDPSDHLPPGSAAEVGGGGLRGRGGALVVRRWWSPASLPTGQVDPAAATGAARLLAAGAPRTASSGRATALGAAGPAAAALVAGDPAGAATRLVAVLGLGPGTTPSGDDVAAGVLLAARATGSDPRVLDRLARSLLEAAASRTTAVSAALLAEAAAGRAAAPVLGLLRALLGRGDVEDCLGRLLAVGSTSGADLATGLVAVARARSARTTTPAPHALRRSA